MEWKNWSFAYEPITKEEARAYRAKVLAALEKAKFRKPIGRFNVRRLWFLFQYARWNPFRKQISFPEAINALAAEKEHGK
jgi:hypothetical protein